MIVCEQCTRHHITSCGMHCCVLLPGMYYYLVCTYQSSPPVHNRFKRRKKPGTYFSAIRVGRCRLAYDSLDYDHYCGPSASHGSVSQSFTQLPDDHSLARAGRPRPTDPATSHLVSSDVPKPRLHLYQHFFCWCPTLAARHRSAFRSRGQRSTLQ